jgi:hypothetical protein
MASEDIDIVTLLREDFCDFGQWENSCTPEGKCPCCLAADEIELLRVALQMACYEVFAYCDPLKTSPKELVAHFMNEAVRGE